jgi:hypothetical protein
LQAEVAKARSDYCRKGGHGSATWFERSNLGSMHSWGDEVKMAVCNPTTMVRRVVGDTADSTDGDKVGLVVAATVGCIRGVVDEMVGHMESVVVDKAGHVREVGVAVGAKKMTAAGSAQGARRKRHPVHASPNVGKTTPLHRPRESFGSID